MVDNAPIMAAKTLASFIRLEKIGRGRRHDTYQLGQAALDSHWIAITTQKVALLYDDDDDWKIKEN